jgi:hypothetical protein
MKCGIAVSVTAIANGYLLTKSKTGDNGYSTAHSVATFYPSMEAIEAELIDQFRDALSLEVDDRDPDF